MERRSEEKVVIFNLPCQGEYPSLALALRYYPTLFGSRHAEALLLVSSGSPPFLIPILVSDDDDDDANVDAAAIPFDIRAPTFAATDSTMTLLLLLCRVAGVVVVVVSAGPRSEQICTALCTKTETFSTGGYFISLCNTKKDSLLSRLSRTNMIIATATHSTVSMIVVSSDMDAAKIPSQSFITSSM